MKSGGQLHSPFVQCLVWEDQQQHRQWLLCPACCIKWHRWYNVRKTWVLSRHWWAHLPRGWKWLAGMGVLDQQPIPYTMHSTGTISTLHGHRLGRLGHVHKQAVVAPAFKDAVRLQLQHQWVGFFTRCVRVWRRRLVCAVVWQTVLTCLLQALISMQSRQCMYQCNVSACPASPCQLLSGSRSL